MEKLSDKNIIIVTHKSLMPVIPGNDLKRFLLKSNVNKLIYITHPLLLLKESSKLSSQFEFYENSNIKKTSNAHHWILPESIAYIKDFIYTLIWIIKSNKTFDIYFGINNLNAFSGLILKNLGRVKKVVYYTIDLYPQRFSNKVVNWIYHRLDRICVQYCDETWNVSPFLTKWRAKQGMVGEKFSRQVTVPIGIWFADMNIVPNHRVNIKKIVYVGHLKNFYGVDLIILALPEIIKKIPGVKLEIIGGGEQLDELKQLIGKLKLTSDVKFLGWKDKEEAEKLMSDASIGLAPFDTRVDEKLKNADPAKIKDYLSLGLPVVMTSASINASAIDRAKCGIIIDFTKESLVKAVVKLLSNRKLWSRYRKNARKYVKQFDWNILFSKNISRLT